MDDFTFRAAQEEQLKRDKDIKVQQANNYFLEYTEEINQLQRLIDEAKSNKDASRVQVANQVFQ